MTSAVVEYISGRAFFVGGALIGFVILAILYALTAWWWVCRSERRKRKD
jgi:hypothetical protein